MFDCCPPCAIIGDDRTKGAGRWLECWLFFRMAATVGASVGVGMRISSGSVECIIDGSKWKLRGEHKH